MFAEERGTGTTGLTYLALVGEKLELVKFLLLILEICFKRFEFIIVPLVQYHDLLFLLHDYILHRVCGLR